MKLRGIDKVGWLFTFTGAAYNLCRLRNLIAQNMKRNFDFVFVESSSKP